MVNGRGNPVILQLPSLVSKIITIFSEAAKTSYI